MTDWTKRRDELAKEQVNRWRQMLDEHKLMFADVEQAWSKGYDQARADMIDEFSQWKWADEVKRAVNEAIPLEDAHSKDTAYLARRAWTNGARWQFERIKKKLGLG